MFLNILLGIACSLFKRALLQGDTWKHDRIWYLSELQSSDVRCTKSELPSALALSNVPTGAPTAALTGDARRHFGVCLPSPLIPGHVSCRREAGGLIPAGKWISPPTLIISEDCQFPLAAHTMGCVINAGSIKLTFHSRGDKAASSSSAG